MDERRVPNLEEMDEQQAHHFLTKQLANLSAEEEYELRHEDYAMQMPQSGERILGREKRGSSRRLTLLSRLFSYAGWWLGMACGSSRVSTTTARDSYLPSCS